MALDDFKKGLSAIVSPDKGTKTRMSLVDALKMYYRFSIIPLILAVIASLVAGVFLTGGAASVGAEGGLFGSAVIALAAVGSVLYVLLFLPVVLLIESVGVHIIGKVLGMFGGSFDNTATGIIYAGFVPLATFWLTWIPGVGLLVVILADIYSIWIYLVAESNQHGTSKLNALIVGVVASVVVGVVLFVLLGSVLVSLLGSTLAATNHTGVA